MRDYYEILDISENASQDEIKSSYRKLAKKYHPDLNPGNEEAEQSFKEINQAYEVLSDPGKRQRYDTFGPEGVNGQGGHGAGFEDVFGGGFGDFIGDIFGGGFSQSSRRGSSRGVDLRYDLKLDFYEAVFGVEKEIKVTKPENCGTCDGSGVEPGSSKETCAKCNGSGQVRYSQQSPFGQIVRTVTCDECGGTGEIIKDKCKICSGTGKEVKAKKIKIKVPAGVDTGSIISIQGEGAPGEKNGPSGDLYVYINVKPHKIFERRGNDIYYTIPISFTEAALGAKIKIPILNDTMEYTIPKGTQTGTRFKLPNRGVANVRGVGKGDLYFKVKIEVPEKLTKRQKELLEKFAEETGESTKKSKKGFFDKLKDNFGN